ncbi:MAG: PD-(D/E)XK nuclease family protein [Candidatus Eremiobacteraeota bacterium]|nr:PD-(D/E)XK nuclease family protein [Candidatus Eremiobacteraeota bacterium]
MKDLVVSPSSFGFLYEECPACYYNSVHGLRRRPSTPFPSIFTQIDRAMKVRFSAPGWHVVAGERRRFKIAASDGWVRSAPIPVRGHDLTLTIRGTFDSVLRFEDGRFGLCDWKTAPVKADLLSKYSRQLHAYAFALERPALDEPQRIDELGLGVFEPAAFDVNAGAQASLTGGLTWLAMTRDDVRFARFLQSVGQLLALPNAPPPSPSCAFCAYRAA